MTRSAISSDSRTPEMRVSVYDRVSGGLWTLIIVFGLLALMVAMTTLQLQREKSMDSEWQSNVRLIPSYIGQSNLVGEGVNVADAGVEEFADVDNSQLADAVQAVTDVPTNVRGSLANIDGTEEKNGPGTIPFGPRKLDPRSIDAAQRWSIEYEPQNIENYFEQLSSLGIEIGFVSKGVDQVEILVDLNTTPKIRNTTKEQERRYFFIHGNSKLRNWELRVARDAGVNPSGKIMVQFCPEVILTQLAKLEADEAQRRGIELKQIQRTLFKVRTTGNVYEFELANMISY